MASLQLSVIVAPGYEVATAKDLLAKTPRHLWPLLVGLAAEIVTEHEARVNGSRVILAPADQADRILKDLSAAKLR